MAWTDGLRERLRALFNKGALERELDDELRFHIEKSTDKNIRTGMDPATARRAARIEIGGLEGIKENVRDERGTRLFEDLASDLRYALRTLLKNPGFSVVTVLALALGIAATTAIFSVMKAVVLDPLPYPDPDRLIYINELTPQGHRFGTSEPNFLDFRDQSQSFSEMAAMGWFSRALVGDGDPEQLELVGVTADFFHLLGATAQLGRVFTAEEDTPGGDSQVVVLSHGLWQRRFGSDDEILGTKLALDGEPFTVIGVMQADFEFDGDTDAWIPLAPKADAMRADHRLSAFGRLKPEISMTQARDDMEAIAELLSSQYPQSNGGWTIDLTTFPETFVGPDLNQAFLVLVVAVGLLLLIACANVSNLLLVRAMSRQRELGMRAALGAGRFRLVRQLVTESMVLAAAGGALGLGLAYAFLPLIKALAPVGIPRLDEVGLNGGVLLFTFLLSILTALLCGVAPAFQSTRMDIKSTLTDGGRVITPGGRRLRGVLVIGEIALAAVVLIGAGLMVRSFQQLQAIDSGFDARSVLQVPLALTGPKYSASPQEQTRLLGEMLDRARALPGVLAAGATNVSPLRGGSTGMELTIEGRATDPSNDSYFADWRAIVPGFFDALQVSLIKGRLLTAEDIEGPVRSVVVTQTLAGDVWPDQDPIGKRFAFGVGSDRFFTVVGVVGDLKDVALDRAPRPVAFMPHPFTGWPNMTLLLRTAGLRTAGLRTAGDIAGLSDAIRREIWAVDPELPIPTVEPLNTNLDSAVARPRFGMVLMSVFAGLSLVLASLGIYGLISQTMSQRTYEIGVRMALGARSHEVSQMVVGQGLKLGALGLLVGLGVAFVVTRFLETLLYEMSPTDPLTFLTVAALLLGVSSLASLLPALRAAGIDPVRALRAD